MRVFSPLVLSSLLVASPFAHTAASTLGKRSFEDTCASIELNLAAKFNLPYILPNDGKLSICLCVGGLSDFVDSNIITKIVAASKGKQAVVDAFASIIISRPSRKKCSYPDGSSPICGTDCQYKCRGNRPKCPDGSCKSPCPSAVPPPSKRDQTLVIATCPHGHEVCGVLDEWSVLSGAGWECVDTRSHLESCGGCVTPFAGQPAAGVDCTEIRGVTDVRCNSGECVVKRCRKGWIVSEDGSSCMKLSRTFGAA